MVSVSRVLVNLGFLGGGFQRRVHHGTPGASFPKWPAWVRVIPRPPFYLLLAILFLSTCPLTLLLVGSWEDEEK